MKILGIDDNEDLLQLSEIALIAAGHKFTGINNGKDFNLIFGLDFKIEHQYNISSF